MDKFPSLLLILLILFSTLSSLLGRNDSYYVHINTFFL